MFSYFKFWQLQLNSQKRQKWTETKTSRLWNGLKRKKRKLPKFPTFRFFPIPKIEKAKILESFLLLQIFTVVVTFSKFVFSRERVKPCFFVTFNIKSRLSWKFHWSSSSCLEDMEIFLFNINIFINFSTFLTFPCYKEINDVSIKQMISTFF